MPETKSNCSVPQNLRMWFLVGKAHNFTSADVGNFQSGKEEFQWDIADYPVCMNTDPCTQMVKIVLQKKREDIFLDFWLDFMWWLNRNRCERSHNG